jgi:hypothetical protein
MQLLCPHCHNPIEAVALGLARELLCPLCGSTFRLDMGSTVTWPLSEGPDTPGPYELVGMGELGSVYKAHDPELDRTVAIKTPHAGILVSDEDRKRFLREARNVAHLAYPSIVPVHEVGEHGGIPFLVSDFVEGVTHSDKLSGRQPRSSMRWSTSKSTVSSIARSSRRTSCSTSRTSRNNRYFEMGRNQGTLRMRLRRCDLIPKSLMLTLHCLDPPR